MKYAVILFMLTANLFAQTLTHPQHVFLNGELGDRAELTVKRMHHPPYDEVNFIAQDVARVENLTRRFEEYEGDVSGRYLGALSYYSRLADQHPENLAELAKEILSHQDAAGFFGVNQQKQNWDFWGRQIFGHGRLLGGLVQYYKFSSNPEILQAAVKLGDYFCSSMSEWKTSFKKNPWTNNHTNVNWESEESNRQHFVKTHMTSILESLVMLYEVTQDEKYLQAGMNLVDFFPTFGQYHAHSYLNTMTGMAMLYYYTHDAKLHDKLMGLYWHDVTAHGDKIDGVGWEWFPFDHRTEGCTVTDWLRVNLYLWQATLDPVYLEAAENAWYNSLYFHQTAQGAFGHAIVTEDGYDANYVEAWWCCLMHGLWAFDEIANFIAVESAEKVWINFYEPSTINLNFAEIQISGTYPQQGNVQLEIIPEKQIEMPVYLRIPAWTEKLNVTINGKASDYKIDKGYAVLTRKWKKSDKISIQFPIELRLVDEHHRNYLDLRQLPNETISGYFYHGPLLLSADGHYNSIMPKMIFFQPGKDYHVKGAAQTFSMPQAHYLLPMTHDTDIRDLITTVTLAPMSEMILSTSWSEQMDGFLRNSEKPIHRKHSQLLQNVQIKQ